MKQPTFLFLWTRLGSICSKAGDLVAISLATKPQLTHQANVGPILQCVLPFQRMCECTYSTHWPYNTQLLLVFLNTHYRDLIPEQERGLVRPHLPNYVIVWDNVSFHRTNIVRDWFAAHERITVVFLPPYSPFLNPVEEFFQHGGGKYMIIDHKIRCLCWMSRFMEIFPRCMAMEMLIKIFGLTNKSDRMSTKNYFFHGCYFVVIL